MNRDELIALAKRVTDHKTRPYTPEREHGSAHRATMNQLYDMSRAFLDADAERERLEDLKSISVQLSIRAERDRLQAEVERLREFETRYVRLTSVRTSHGPPCVCDRCLSVMFAERTVKAEAELSALRAEIEKAPVIYWHESSNPDEVGPYAVSQSPGYRDTHRARLVRIEKL